MLVMLSRQYSRNFNSIKVRLKHADIYVDVHSKEFQFHKGTIETPMLPSTGVL